MNSRVIGTWKRKTNFTKDDPFMLFLLTCSHHSITGLQPLYSLLLFSTSLNDFDA
jgi:hypothetical protein